MKIDKSLYHEIQLRNVQLVELNCKFNEDIKMDTKKKIPISINTNSSSKVISSELGICYLNVKIGFEDKEEEIFNISVTYKSICETINEINKDELEFFLKVQSVPMLWAYARETINNVMLKMNLPPIVLPAINVIDIMKRFKEESEKCGGVKNDIK